MAMSVSRRPFRARRGPGRHLGFRRSGSTLDYNPAAASRLPSPNERGSVLFSAAGPSPDKQGSVRFLPRARARSTRICTLLTVGPRPDGRGFGRTGCVV